MLIRTPSQKAKAAEIMARVDNAKVVEAIRTVQDLLDFDYANIGEMCWVAAEVWLPQDIDDLVITHIEKKEPYHFAELPNPINIVCDIRGSFTGYNNLFRSVMGKAFVLDWKTSGGELDDRWSNRHVDSWQWKIYLYFTRADVFVYRGISRKGRTRQIVLPRYEGLDEDVERQISGVNKMRSSLIGDAVWPQSMPSACGAYGQRCTYWDDCRENKMPKDIVIPKSLSYSAMDTFLLCPEKNRRDELVKLLDGERTESYEQKVGQAFHAGQAEIYRQLFGLESKISESFLTL